MHSRPVPRAGGLAILPSLLLALAAVGSTLSAALAAGGVIIFLAGIYDDLRGLSPLQKLTAQAVAAAVSLHILGLSGLYFLLAAFWVVLLTNALNLIDGLDGLCTGVSLSASLFLFVIAGRAEALCLSAALFGFLPMNRHPAKMFLGDSGAMTAGFFLALLSLSPVMGELGARGILAAALILALPLFDTLAAFARRALSGRSPFSPDRLHLHHRLVDSGLSHRRASSFLVILSIALGCVGALIYFGGLSVALAVCVALLLTSLICTRSMIAGTSFR
jgi:UDP-GlcNAc:undecaprenyl-phosphate GlcNAc-1-phosphate transferase